MCAVTLILLLVFLNYLKFLMYYYFSAFHEVEFISLGLINQIQKVTSLGEVPLKEERDITPDAETPVPPLETPEIVCLNLNSSTTIAIY